MLNKKIVAIIWNCLILTFCLINLSNVNEVQKINIPHIDKMVHFSFYTISSFLWSWALLNSKSKHFYFNLILIVLGLIMFGLGIEFLQDILPTKRSFEWYDVLANTLGVLFGTSFYLVFLKYKPHA